MPENKIVPIALGGGGYTVAPTDIGSGYAAGITSAGKSIAGAISGIMGGVDAQGNVTHGILEQNQTNNDLLGFLRNQKDAQGNPILSEDAYNSIMGKSLGARQQVVGSLMGQFAYNAQQAIEQQNKLAQIAATCQQTQATTALSEAGATQRSQAALELERQKLLLDPKYQQIKIVP